MKNSGKLLYAAVFAAVVALLVTACKDPSGPDNKNPNPDAKIPVTGVTLNKSTLNLAVGGTEKLTATVQPATAANKSVTWSSGNTDVATVKNGTVSAVAEGRTMITVTAADGGSYAVCTVRVTAAGSPVDPPAEPDQTPVSGDYTVSELTHTWDGNPKEASIEPKEDRSSGDITVYYEGTGGTTYAKSATPPSAAGTYTVTFDVAAAAGWEAANGLPAGIMVINEDKPDNQTPVADDYEIDGLEQIHDGSPKTVTIEPKADKSTGAVTVYYDGSTTAPSAVGTYTVTFYVAAADGWNAASGLPAGTLVIANDPNSTVKYKIYSDGILSEGYGIDIWANAAAFQLASTSGGGHSGTKAIQLPNTGAVWGRGISIRASSASVVDWSTVDALSFWVKGDNVRIDSFGFLDDKGAGDDPLNVEHKGENEQGITIGNTWQQILVPLPASHAKNAAISRTEVFKIYLDETSQDGKAVYIDDIELIPASRDFTISIPSTATVSSGTVSIASLLGNYKAEYTVNGKTVPFYNNTVPFANWFDITYNVGGSATRSGNNINATGNFTLTVSFGGKTSNTLNVTVTQPQPVNQTPVAGDYNFGNLSQTAGSVTAVTITPKSGKSSGARTIFYNGSQTIPQTAGSHAVTFNVAAATGWNAATGLSAGTLVVSNPPAPTSPWNVAPTIKSTFYDDFSTGINTSNWRVDNDQWGANNNGVKSGNVSYTTNRTIAAAFGSESGGVVVLQANGDFMQTSNRRREGSNLVTRQAYGPGKYEVRMKVLPRLGQCTALWTYWRGDAGKGISFENYEQIKYSEIDIELPLWADYRNISGVTYQYFSDSWDWNTQVNKRREVVNIEDRSIPALNDGQWHTFAFDWRTNTATNDRGIIWYVDGQEYGRKSTWIPEYTATYNIGSWFPDDVSWIGDPIFETAYMYIDWVRITQYNDPVQTGSTGSGNGGTPANLGSNPIPLNNYISNGTFGQDLTVQNTKSQSITSWTQTAGTVTRATGPNRLTLAASSKTMQPIGGQYAGYTFRLDVDAQVTGGSGKCKAYVEYCSGTATTQNPALTVRGQSAAIEFTAGSRASKNLVFTVAGSNVNHLRVVIETEAGTTATVYEVKMVLN